MFTLGALAAAASPIFAAGHIPNYMASVDGYAPADYDGDLKVDFAIKDFGGVWAIDYAANGFGAYDVFYFGYGGQNNLPVPADYDGDGNIDLAIKSHDQGRWNIDYASNGFGVWDASYAGYGGAENIPVPADYTNDGRADLAIWTQSGFWAGNFNIDYAHNGFGTWDISFQRVLPGPGRPAVGDFDGDCLPDFSVKRDDGSWHLLIQTVGGAFSGCFDRRGFFTGFTYNVYHGYGGSLNRPIPADYDGDRVADLAVRAEVNPTSFNIDYWAINGFGAWDAVFHP